MPARTVRTGGWIDLRLTLSPVRHGAGDPSVRLWGRECRRAFRTPGGPVSARLALTGPGEVEVEAWGPGAAWALETAPDLLGVHDDPRSFRPEHPAVRRLHRHLHGLRIGRSRGVIETLVPAIVQQKVTAAEALRSYRRLVLGYGEPAPGPLGLWLPPAPAVLASLPYHAFHRFGIERRRADAIRRACSYAQRLEECVSLPRDVARRRLLALPGVGPWTAAIVESTALGDPDAVIVGDYHLPHLVSWVLAAEPRSDDRRMIELLEPFAGHRGRVLRLIVAGGARPPARHPHRRLRAIASI
jgi:3-methyladenine DNA glycosylase/8-oxoguanine DNA glycosylase